MTRGDTTTSSKGKLEVKGRQTPKGLAYKKRRRRRRRVSFSILSTDTSKGVVECV